LLWPASRRVLCFRLSQLFGARSPILVHLGSQLCEAHGDCKYSFEDRWGTILAAQHIRRTSSSHDSVLLLRNTTSHLIALLQGIFRYLGAAQVRNQGNAVVANSGMPRPAIDSFEWFPKRGRDAYTYRLQIEITDCGKLGFGSWGALRDSWYLSQLVATRLNVFADASATLRCCLAPVSLTHRLLPCKISSIPTNRGEFNSRGRTTCSMVATFRTRSRRVPISNKYAKTSMLSTPRVLRGVKHSDAFRESSRRERLNRTILSTALAATNGISKGSLISSASTSADQLMSYRSRKITLSVTCTSWTAGVLARRAECAQCR
jgi:hypothetical protein